MITIRASRKPQPVASRLMEQAALAVLADQAADGDLTIILTDDSQLQQLNRDYLGLDAPTDVLSFPADEVDPATGRRYLGDILISIPRAGDQAGRAGHALEAEIQLLVVHGVLHLLGHDHARAGGKRRMWSAQTKILQQLGLDGIQIPE